MREVGHSWCIHNTLNGSGYWPWSILDDSNTNRADFFFYHSSPPETRAAILRKMGKKIATRRDLYDRLYYRPWVLSMLCIRPSGFICKKKYVRNWPGGFSRNRRVGCTYFHAPTGGGKILLWIAILSAMRCSGDLLDARNGILGCELPLEVILVAFRCKKIVKSWCFQWNFAPPILTPHRAKN